GVELNAAIGDVLQEPIEYVLAFGQRLRERVGHLKRLTRSQGSGYGEWRSGPADAEPTDRASLCDTGFEPDIHSARSLRDELDVKCAKRRMPLCDGVINTVDRFDHGPLAKIALSEYGAIAQLVESLCDFMKKLC